MSRGCIFSALMHSNFICNNLELQLFQTFMTMIGFFLNPYRKSPNFCYKFDKLLTSLFASKLYIKNKYKWRHMGAQIRHTISSNLYNIEMAFRATSSKMITKPLKHMIYFGENLMTQTPLPPNSFCKASTPHEWNRTVNRNIEVELATCFSGPHAFNGSCLIWTFMWSQILEVFHSRSHHESRVPYIMRID